MDARRFARIRLLDCPGSEIRNTTPLVENGPDPIIDRETLTLEWLTTLMKKKHVPVKALLLDQANISGIGNWVGDEIMYHARLHPEQYSDTFSDAQLAQLYKSLMYVCGLAVETLSDSSKFPDDWLFKHRWGKGKKDARMNLPSGEALAFLTVGGRTSCIVPSLQKKTGAVAGDVKKEDLTNGEKETKKAKGKKDPINEEEHAELEETGAKPNGKKRKAETEKEVSEKSKKGNGVKKAKPAVVKEEVVEDTSRRRSGRLRK